jgi:hypothetical protein
MKRKENREQNTVNKAVETLVSFYRDRELLLAKELMEKHGYIYTDLAKIQGITPQAAATYYKRVFQSK